MFSCSPVSVPNVIEEDITDENNLETTISPLSKTNIFNLDIFIYEATGTRKMFAHLVNETRVNLPEGEYLVAVIANCPGKFNDKVLGRYESMETLKYNFENDNPKRPVLSGMQTVVAGKENSVELNPVICKIEISSVDSDIDIYNLKLYLKNIASEAELFRWSKFSSAESISSGAEYCFWGRPDWQYSFYPHESLWCYPDDGRDFSRTSISVEFGFDGRDYLHEFDLPPLGRADQKSVFIFINDPDNVILEIY